MSEIALTVIKVLFLALLWVFIASAVSVIRSDLFGRTVPMPGPAGRAGARAAAAAAEEDEAARGASRGSW